MIKIDREYFAKNFPEFYELLKKDDIEALPDGNYPCDGVDCFFQSYNTKAPADSKFETHIKMVDVQYLRQGKENIAVAPIESLTVTEEYIPDRDVAFYSEPENFEEYVLNPGDGLILFPNDGHRPGVNGQEDITSFNKKVVLKVPVGSEQYKKL